MILLLRHHSDFMVQFAGVFSNMVRACVAAEQYAACEDSRDFHYTLHRIEQDQPLDWRTVGPNCLYPHIVEPPKLVTIKPEVGTGKLTYIFPSGNRAQRHPRNQLQAN